MKIKYATLILLTTVITLISCDSKTEKGEGKVSTVTENTTASDTCNYDFNISINPEKLTVKDLTNLNVELTNGNITVEEGKVMLERQQLKALPKEILEYNCIHTLMLAKNKFGKFPTEVFEIKRLKKIDLSESSIKKFPSITAVTNLETLNLNSNKITVINANDLLKFKHLKNLFLKGNAQLADLPDEIKQMKKLKSLDIRGTKLGKSYTKVRKLMKDIPNVKVFYR